MSARHKNQVQMNLKDKRKQKKDTERSQYELEKTLRQIEKVNMALYT